jgi:hypothetical protein
MNLLKKGILVFLVTGVIVSCEDNDELNNPDGNITGTGLTEISFPLKTLAVVSDEKTGGDGTIVTVTPQGFGVDYYEVDFGDPNSTADVITISDIAFRGSAIYDYPNESKTATYTITVTAKSNKGLADVAQTKDITLTHSVQSIDTSPDSPTEEGRNNMFSIYTNGFEYEGSLVSYAAGTSATGGSEVALASGNAILEFSRLGSDAGALKLGGNIVTADAFASGIGVNNIHFDVHSNFATGINVLKLTLVDNTNSVNYVIDGIALTDGECVSLDYDLATDFSAPVVQFDEIKFEVGTGGSANDHATLNVDNIYMPRVDRTTILNGDFNSKQDFWKWAVFTDGETNPFGSSSDGSWTNYDGTSNGSKTPGAKWSSSQSGGALRTSTSRYAYQALTLTPNTSYTLEYEYAIKSDSSDKEPVGGRRIEAVILDQHYVDGAKAASNVSSNLGSHVGTIAEGKFNATRGTKVLIPFTTNSSGEIAVMFYAVTPQDSWIDNVKVY